MHIPVLLNETIDGLDIKKGETLVDATFGLGGHSREVYKRYKGVKIIALDLNGDTLFESASNLKSEGCDIVPVKANFRHVDSALQSAGINKADKFLFDLGWSSPEFEKSGRGFSFLRNEPLIMSFDSERLDGSVTAYDVVNDWSEDTLQAIILGFGEERRAKKIAKAICEARKTAPIKTTFELVDVIRKAFPRDLAGKTHFATKTFQAIRIAVNDELESLKEGLAKAVLSINTGGRIAVISFHSLEDRIVKNFFKEIKDSGRGRILTKKPIIPSREEIKRNPRSRSAKLRIIEIND